MSRTIHLRFYECEHHGDLNAYVHDLRQSGAKVLDQCLNEAAEEAVVKLTVEDFPAFKAAWQQTESADFADSLDWLEESHA
jgi:hypothetical protein